jgi:hypothetical protein
LELSLLLHSALLALPSLVLCVLLALQSLVSEPHEFLSPYVRVPQTERVP